MIKAVEPPSGPSPPGGNASTLNLAVDDTTLGFGSPLMRNVCGLFLAFILPKPLRISAEAVPLMLNTPDELMQVGRIICVSIEHIIRT